MKYDIAYIMDAMAVSLPSRERGLKSLRQVRQRRTLPSLPSRERGLKCLGVWSDFRAGFVAPFAGAWIEISAPSCASALFTVAPFAGAWIEIFISCEFSFIQSGRSLRGSVD